MDRIIYPGTFDPITVGHVDVIERASRLCDELVIAIMENKTKQTKFSLEERREMIEASCAHIENIKVVSSTGLTVDLAAQMNARALVRGIRAVMDYEYELRTATANLMLNPDVETIFLVSRPEYSYVSSSVVKEISYHQGDVESLVHPFVRDKLIETYQK